MAPPPPSFEKLTRDSEAAGEASLAGKVLVAMPGQTRPPFANSVVYLCAHGSQGAMGLIVSQRLSRPGFAEVMRQLKLPSPPERSLPLMAGGPVQPGRGFVLHSADWEGESSLRAGEMMLTTSLDVLRAVAVGEGPREGLLALGYAGWGPGQLEREIGENAWLSGSVEAPLIFGADHANRWRDVLVAMNIDPLLLSSAAGRA